MDVNMLQAQIDDHIAELERIGKAPLVEVECKDCGHKGTLGFGVVGDKQGNVIPLLIVKLAVGKTKDGDQIDLVYDTSTDTYFFRRPKTGDIITYAGEEE